MVFARGRPSELPRRFQALPANVMQNPSGDYQRTTTFFDIVNNTDIVDGALVSVVVDRLLCFLEKRLPDSGFGKEKTFR